MCMCTYMFMCKSVCVCVHVYVVHICVCVCVSVNVLKKVIHDNTMRLQRIEKNTYRIIKVLSYIDIISYKKRLGISLRYAH